MCLKLDSTRLEMRRKKERLTRCLSDGESSTAREKEPHATPPLLSASTPQPPCSPRYKLTIIGRGESRRRNVVPFIFFCHLLDYIDFTSRFPYKRCICCNHNTNLPRGDTTTPIRKTAPQVSRYTKAKNFPKK